MNEGKRDQHLEHLARPVMASEREGMDAIQTTDQQSTHEHQHLRSGFAQADSLVSGADGTAWTIDECVWDGSAQSWVTRHAASPNVYNRNAWECHGLPVALDGRYYRFWEARDHQGILTTFFDSGIAPGVNFAVKVWRDGGTTDGDATNECDRTYKVRTINATDPATGDAATLGTGLSPKKRRWVTNHYGKYNILSTTGTGVVGMGYYDESGTFCLWDANETAATAACP